MSIINMVKNIKEIQSKTIVLLKVGAFCESYGKDSYILSYLLGYEIKEVKDGIYKVGFSKKAIKKVITKLEEEKIDYLLLDVKNNYDVDEKYENGNLNRYDIVFEKSYKYVKKIRKIKDINEKLIRQINEVNFKEKVRKIEEILNEKRKV